MAARVVEQRRVAQTPSLWGVSPELQDLATSAETVEVFHDPTRRGRIVHAKRSDVFSLIDMTPFQLQASQRYWRDWCHRAGVMTEDPRPRLDERVDHSPGLSPGQTLTQQMIDAGKRLDEAHGEIGRGDAQLLRALVEPLVMLGEIRVWRVVVLKVTGESERHAQAARVRSAVENLRLAYEVIDERERKAREAKRRLAEAANDLPAMKA